MFCAISRPFYINLFYHLTNFWRAVQMLTSIYLRAVRYKYSVSALLSDTPNLRSLLGVADLVLCQYKAIGKIRVLDLDLYFRLYIPR
jgi:hypothetical protein